MLKTTFQPLCWIEWQFFKAEPPLACVLEISFGYNVRIWKMKPDCCFQLRRESKRRFRSSNRFPWHPDPCSPRSQPIRRSPRPSSPISESASSRAGPSWASLRSRLLQEPVSAIRWLDKLWNRKFSFFFSFLSFIRSVYTLVLVTRFCVFRLCTVWLDGAIYGRFGKFSKPVTIFGPNWPNLLVNFWNAAKRLWFLQIKLPRGDCWATFWIHWATFYSHLLVTLTM